MKTVTTAAICLALSAPVGAATLPSGDFLNFPVDVRSLGMGEASAAVAEGAGEVFTNPAAIDEVSASHAYFTHGFLTAGINADYLSYAATAGPHHIGVSYYNVGYGTLKGADDAGNQTSNFSPSDTMYGLSYGTKVLGADLGATLKYVDSTIVNRASAMAFDAGGQYQLGPGWRLGLVGQNLGGRLKYENAGYPLPAKIVGALGWKATEDWWLTLDAVSPLYTPSYVAMGTEYRLPVGGIGQLAFRVGINTRTPDLGALSGLKAGFGLKLKSLDIDYALDAQGELGQAHHLGMGYRFDWPHTGKR